jgi:hypothetical protein
MLLTAFRYNAITRTHVDARDFRFFFFFFFFFFFLTRAISEVEHSIGRGRVRLASFATTLQYKTKSIAGRIEIADGDALPRTSQQFLFAQLGQFRIVFNASIITIIAIIIAIVVAIVVVVGVVGEAVFFFLQLLLQEIIKLVRTHFFKKNKKSKKCEL